MNKNAIYAGTFDPITCGHLDIIIRATKIFDNIIIAIYDNPNKKTMFTLHERMKFIHSSTVNLKNIKKIIGFNDLLAHVAKKEKSNILIRGMRTASDFHYEIKLAEIHKQINPNLESLFFIAEKEFSFISSSFVKEVAKYKGNIQPYIPKDVYQALLKKYKKLSLVNIKTFILDT